MVIVQLLGAHTSFHEIQLSFWLVIGLIFAYMKVCPDIKNNGS